MSKNILLGVTGSIAAYKACEIISLLKKKGHKVKCVMSTDAKWFVTPLSLEVLTGNTVACDMFARPEKRTTEHVSLSDEADVILVAPATADILGKVASGICDDMLACVICASERPVIFAPAMNDKMYKNPIVQDKIAYLKEKGYHFIEPVVGHLACGTEGMGHLAPVETIVEETLKVLNGRI